MTTFWSTYLYCFLSHCGLKGLSLPRYFRCSYYSCS